MARSDLILNLVRAGARGDQTQLQKTVEALAADERAKNHSVLADRLLAQLQESTQARQMKPINGMPSAGPLVSEMIPQKPLSELILQPRVESPVLELIEEQLRSDLLRAHNIEPRNRVLLAGSPGNGKTTLAECIAHSLSVPLLLVRYDAIIGSYLGETAQRIAQVFEYARTRRCVLFFDEFDAIGKERGDLHETGEIKRVVSSLLLNVDALPSYVVVVAASNHPELLDRAVWRRFQVRLELGPPGQREIVRWLQRFEEQIKERFQVPARTLAQSLSGLSFAEVEAFGMDVLRRIVLAQGATSNEKIVRGCLAQWKERFTLAKPKAPRRK